MDELSARAELLTVQKHRKIQTRAIAAQGFGASYGSVKITKTYHQQISSFISAKLCERGGVAVETEGLLRVLRQLDPGVIALCVLQSALHSVAIQDDVRGVCIRIGGSIADECWAQGLLRHDTKLAQKVEEAARRRSALTYRKQSARSIAARAGYQMKHWSRQQKAQAGALLLSWLLEGLPEVFEKQDASNEFGCELGITEGAEALASDAVDYVLRNYPVRLPISTAPAPWTGWNQGGYPAETSRTGTALLRTQHRETEAAVRAAIKNGSMQPFLDALNDLQAVPFTINAPVFDVMEMCLSNGTLGYADIEMPSPMEDWESRSEEDRRLHRYRISKVKQGNRTLRANHLLYVEDLKTADILKQHERFYTPCNADWRGRVYAMTHFNFQREDRVRALFLFADGAPMTEDGLYWLKVHVANCGDFGKISKRPFDERVQWVEENLEWIKAVAGKPTVIPGWLDADKPFLFLAACMELAGALVAGTAYVTRLPVSFDGSCSGLQHLSAMTRAPEGSLVNLTSGSEPQDVYQTVADLVKTRIEADLDVYETAIFARLCLAYGIDRKLVKRNVMTFSYSSKKFGMSQQHMEDLMKPLAFDVLQKKIDEHPFASEYDFKFHKETGKKVSLPDGSAAAKYLAGHVYNAIGYIVSRPAQAMGFLQQLARVMAHEGKCLRWTTPTGLPWCNRYHTANVKRLKLWLGDTFVRAFVPDGHKKTIDKDRAANGVAPNFVHALDAAHLMLTANAAAQEGICIATVHDSFGCLAPHATRFRDIVREQFVEMYEQHDVLTEVFDQASCDLTVHNHQRLPEKLTYGSLDIREVLNAPFAFS